MDKNMTMLCLTDLDTWQIKTLFCFYIRHQRFDIIDASSCVHQTAAAISRPRSTVTSYTDKLSEKHTGNPENASRNTMLYRLLDFEST